MVLTVFGAFGDAKTNIITESNFYEETSIFILEPNLGSWDHFISSSMFHNLKSTKTPWAEMG